MKITQPQCFAKNLSAS